MASKGKLSADKRKILEHYGAVYAPDIDYSTKHDLKYIKILKQFSRTEINAIIGSSMGALNSYIISNWIGRPALLFQSSFIKTSLEYYAF